MEFQNMEDGADLEDDAFNSIFPGYIRHLASTHFTPVDIAQKAADFLVDERGTKVLDIGSGAGKFCMVGAAHTKGFFTGVEQREKLHLMATYVARNQELSNVNFIHANIKEIDFLDYQAFYFYNSFFENIMRMDRIDDSIDLTKDLYIEYSQYVKEQLDKMPVGTKLATYFSSYDEVPESYKIYSSEPEQQKLTLWEKVVDGKTVDGGR